VDYRTIRDSYVSNLKLYKNSITAYQKTVDSKKKSLSEISKESYDYLDKEYEEVFFIQGGSKRGVLKTTGKYVGALLSFGGSYFLEFEKKHYNDLYEAFYQPLLSNLTILETDTNKVLNSIGIDLQKFNEMLKKSHKILKSNHFEANHINQSKQVTTLNQLKHFSAEFHTSLNAGYGGLVGGSTALGAWGVVTLIGSASTGTSISALSGVAATNATLAWFGGGSLAAGGAGMAGGFMVLGGIVAAPVMYFAIKGSYKRVEKIKEDKVVLIKEIEKLTLLESEANTHLRLLIEHKKIISKLIQDYIPLLDKQIRLFKKHSSFSYKIFGGRLNEEQLIAYEELSKLSSESLFKLGVGKI